MSLLGALILGLSALAPPGEPAAAPFDAAALAPADVSLYVHVEGARDLRARLAGRPIARGVAGAIGGGELGAAWARLSAALGADRGELFDAWFGERCTLMLRTHDDDDRVRGTEWALVTTIEAAAARGVMARLGPRRLAPRHGVPVLEVPEHGLVVAVGRTHAVLGPLGQGALFDDVLARVVDAAGRSPGLADGAAIRRARMLAPGRIEFFVRHGSPLDGWSALTADLRGDDVVIAHSGRFENPPFTRPCPEQDWDMAPLDAFEDGAMFALVEPTEIGSGAFETFLEVSIGQPLLDATLRSSLGARRIVTVGEVEGRLEMPAVDLLLPAGAVAFELREEAGDVRAALDDHLVRVARSLRSVGQGSYLVEVPDARTLRAGEPRHVNVGPALSARSGGFPVMRTVSLNWTVAEGPFGSFCVIATHPAQLEATARALGAERTVTARPGRWATCGTLDGRRLARHLRSYHDRPALLLPSEPDPTVVDDFRFTLGLFADLADGFDRCRWQVVRPSRCDVRLEAQLRLSGAPSAGGE